MKILFACLAASLLSAPVLAISKNPFNDQMLRLNTADRNGALRRAITLDNGHCGRLVKSTYRGMYGNLGMYAARCKPGGDYAIFAGPDSSVQVRSCGELAALKLPECKLD